MEFSGHVSVLGVCLGHPALIEAQGGAIVRAGRPMHGKTSPVLHDGRGIFAGLPNPFEAGRYHSLITGHGRITAFALVLVATAGIGGLIGSYFGSRRFDPAVIKRLLAVVLLIAGTKLIFA